MRYVLSYAGIYNVTSTPGYSIPENDDKISMLDYPVISDQWSSASVFMVFGKKFGKHETKPHSIIMCACIYSFCTAGNDLACSAR